MGRGGVDNGVILCGSVCFGLVYMARCVVGLCARRAVVVVGVRACRDIYLNCSGALRARHASWLSVARTLWVAAPAAMCACVLGGVTAPGHLPHAVGGVWVGE